MASAAGPSLCADEHPERPIDRGIATPDSHGSGGAENIFRDG
jgi:hypothetical protein